MASVCLPSDALLQNLLSYSWQIDGETVEMVSDFNFGGSKITVDCDCSHEEIPHVQGKRNPSKTIGFARGHQRADTLKP